jgi:hypothetical protein
MSARKEFTLEDVSQIAETAANKAVSVLFEKLDIDVSDKESMRRFRDNLTFLDDQRQGSLLLKSHLKKSAIYLSGMAGLGLLYFLWDALKSGLLLWLHRI